MSTRVKATAYMTVKLPTFEEVHIKAIAVDFKAENSPPDLSLVATLSILQSHAGQ